jgi:hypothetical protein
MHLLELLLAIILAPFWIPALLMIVGFLILLVGLLLLIALIVLFLIFCLIGWILKSLYCVHVGLVTTRQAILKEIGAGISWWRLVCLIFKRYIRQIRNRERL